MKLEYFLLFVILILILFIIFKDNGNDALLDKIKAENELMQIEINEIEKEILARIDSINTRDNTYHITRNYYIKQDEEINNINNDTTAVRVIRHYLRQLGKARFD